VLGANAASGTKGSVFLGRPWGDYARVIFQNSNLENMITAVGWEGTSCHIQPLLSPMSSDRNQLGIPHNRRPTSFLVSLTTPMLPEREYRGQKP